MIEHLAYRLLVVEEEYGEQSRTIYVEVCCEECQQRYGYALTRSVQVTGSRARFSSAQRARVKAEAQARQMLDRQLAKAHEPVPCPHCGWIQKKMFPAARAERFPARVPFSAAVALVLAGIAFVLLCFAIELPRELGPRAEAIADGLGITTLLMLCCAGLSWWLHDRRRRSYNPNSTPVEWRLEQGAERALTWAEFQALHPDAYDNQEAERPAG